MFSIRDNLVRERDFASQTHGVRLRFTQNGSSTLTDDSSLFLLHRHRKQNDLNRVSRFRRWFSR